MINPNTTHITLRAIKILCLSIHSRAENCYNHTDVEGTQGIIILISLIKALLFKIIGTL